MWQEWWLRDKALALILCHSQKTFSGAVFTPRQSWFWTVTCRGSGLYSALIPPSLPLQRASSSPWPFDVKFTETETFKSNAQGNLWRSPTPLLPPLHPHWGVAVEEGNPFESGPVRSLEGAMASTKWVDFGKHSATSSLGILERLPHFRLPGGWFVGCAI